MEVKLTTLNVAFEKQKEDIKGVVLQLNFTEKQFSLAYKDVDILKQRMVELWASEDALHVELQAARDEVQSSHTRQEAQRNSFSCEIKGLKELSYRV